MDLFQLCVEREDSFQSAEVKKFTTLQANACHESRHNQQLLVAGGHVVTWRDVSFLLPVPENTTFQNGIQKQKPTARIIADEHNFNIAI
eukprot:1254561-Amphidinium_carterae.1